eukprot:TRINITY_DN100539_c0_g2_i3.p1 TRINITY_DN100539_c0_g2~~TRINITY_DN100539_c0_g2_i3.p1  ORF type:complete len:411 (+),score=104.85 TRINITY_DN100539_c0_g2_i3:312-1544(+)
MTGKHTGVAQRLRNKNPHLINVHCVAHRTALAAQDATKAVQRVANFRNTVNSVYKYYQYSATRNQRLKELSRAMDNEDFISLKQPCAVRWLSLSRAVEAMRLNWAPVVMELEEEVMARKCATAGGLKRALSAYSFTAMMHMMCDVLPVMNRLNLTFQKDDINISSIQPMVKMTTQTLNDLADTPGEHEQRFEQECTEGKFMDLPLLYADEQSVEEYRRMRTNYIQELASALERRFPKDDMDVLTCLDVVLNPSWYPTQECELKEFGAREIAVVTDFFGKPKQNSDGQEAPPLIDAERTRRDFLSVKRVLHGYNRQMRLEQAAKTIITHYAELFPDYAVLCKIAVVIPVSSVAAERGFSLANKIKTAQRSRLGDQKVDRLMQIASCSASMDTFNFAAAAAEFTKGDRKKTM